MNNKPHRGKKKQQKGKTDIHHICATMTDDDVDYDLRRCQNMMQEAYARLSASDPFSDDDLRRVTAAVRAPWADDDANKRRTCW